MQEIRDALNCGKAPLAVVGLGYVGLPLAVALSRHYRVVGFDISSERVEELKQGKDSTREVSDRDMAASGVSYSTDPAVLRGCPVIIVAVPTPVDSHRNPDLSPVIKACRTVGANLGKGSVVVFESTVYPGVTEEVCVPVLEEVSNLRYGQDFFVGYSPERINPGDKVHTLETVTKVVAGCNADVLDLLAGIYGSVVSAGVHRASSIRVAEAAKVIENTQRDLNIALMNELAVIFHMMGIDTLEVLEAAGTKWNFLPFRPGLVGGHCIGVDPYYLTYKAEEMGYRPQVILAGRAINDTMGKYVAETAVKLMIRNDTAIKGARVGVLGLTFKEDVPDLRNSKVIDIIRELTEYGVECLVHDPLADPTEAAREYGVTLASLDSFQGLDALVLAVGHEEYRKLSPEQVSRMVGGNGVVMDVKCAWDPVTMAAQPVIYWRL